MIDSLFTGVVQWRINRLQVFNWGTFSQIHDIPIAERGFLFVGASGSGKSTLLDAMITLLFPNPSYNAAARVGERRRGDRSLLSYVRGAWATQADEEALGSPKAKVQYLRTKATFSAVAVTLTDGLGSKATLMLVASIRKSANEESAINKQFFIINDSYSFNTKDFNGFIKTQFDWRWLKTRLPAFTSYTTFNAYSEAFCERFAIRDKMALKLLAKAQSAKNLGDLNTFLRNFMLEEPRTLSMADRLLEEFQDLSQAHNEVQKAREQRDILWVARKHYRDRELLLREKEKVTKEFDAIDWWGLQTEDRLRRSLLPKLMRNREIAQQGLLRARKASDDIREKVRYLQLKSDQTGGAALARLDSTIENLEKELIRSENRRKQAEEKTATLEMNFPTEIKGWLALQASLSELKVYEKEAEEYRVNLRDKLKSTEREKELLLEEINQEIASMRARPSNIPAKYLNLRAELADELKVAPERLPFVGELVQVKASEAKWQGIIEVVTRNFALSLAADEELFPQLSALIEKKKWPGRLTYFLTREQGGATEVPDPNCIAGKLEYKEGAWSRWVAAQCAARYPYQCVDKWEELRDEEHAAAKSGHIKHREDLYEKNGTAGIADRRNWITGFSNKEKLILFEKQAQQLSQEITEYQRRIGLMDQESRTAQVRSTAADVLINTQWEEIDVSGGESKLQQAKNQRADMISKNVGQQKIQEQLEAAQKEEKRLDQEKESAIRQEERAREEQDVMQQAISACQSRMNEYEQLVDQGNKTRPDEETLAVVESRATNKNKVVITLEKLQPRQETMKTTLRKNLAAMDASIGKEEQEVSRCFREYLQKFVGAQSELDDSLLSAPQFFAKLEEIEADGLPRHEKNFRALLERQSLEHFTELRAELNKAREEIFSRMNMVNASLAAAPFSRLSDGESHLKIEVKNKRAQEVDSFKQELSDLLQGAWDARMTDEVAEDRYQRIERIVAQLNPATPENERWRNLVLDVRNHVTFTACEIDNQGKVIETYFDGSGKSGGQRQKLTTTCLAAALRYQLGSKGRIYSQPEDDLPVFSPVILDEAFDKADSEFTDLSLNIFQRFGFQMIVATPEKAVVTLEPYIGGAYYVVMQNRKVSSGVSITYDENTRRLDFNRVQIPQETMETAPAEDGADKKGEQKSRRKEKTQQDELPEQSLFEEQDLL